MRECFSFVGPKRIKNWHESLQILARSATWNSVYRGSWEDQVLETWVLLLQWQGLAKKVCREPIEGPRQESHLEVVPRLRECEAILCTFCKFFHFLRLWKSQKPLCKLREERQKMTEDTDRTHLPGVNSVSESLLNQENGKDLILNQVWKWVL